MDGARFDSFVRTVVTAAFGLGGPRGAAACSRKGARCGRGQGGCCNGLRCCAKGRAAKRCRAVLVDPGNCGRCGFRCPTGAACSRGTCACDPSDAVLLAPDRLCWLTWGEAGGANGQFSNPSGVAIGPNGHAYVTDTYNHRLQEFTATGGFVRSWGSEGGGDGHFDVPQSVAVGGRGSVYVADFNNNRIVRALPL